MTHTALVNDALFALLAVMILLLSMCIVAVILAPAQRPGSPAGQQPQGATPPPPLPRRQSPATERIAGFHGWSGGDNDTAELGALKPLMPDRIERPEVPGGPPWEPAPKPPGLAQ